MYNRTMLAQVASENAGNPFLITYVLTYVSASHACHSTRSLRLSNTNLLAAPFVRTSFGTRSFSP